MQTQTVSHEVHYTDDLPLSPVLQNEIDYSCLFYFKWHDQISQNIVMYFWCPSLDPVKICITPSVDSQTKQLLWQMQLLKIVDNFYILHIVIADKSCI